MNNIRRYRDGDEHELIAVFRRSVREVASARYTPEQVNAWAGPKRDAEKWAKRMKSAETFVAQAGERLVGWIELALDGHIEMLFCVPEATRNGTATQLYVAAVERSRELGLRKLYCEASLLAESFFTKHGWSVDERQTIDRGGVSLPRARMSITLPEA